MTPGVQIGDRFVSTEDLDARAARAATGFSGLGVGLDDSVAVMLRNDIPFFEASMGARKLGAHSVPINWHLQSEEINYILKDSEAKVLVTHADLLPQIGDAVPPETALIVVPTPVELREAYRIDAESAAVPQGEREWYGWLEEHEPWEKDAETGGGSMIYTSGTTGRPKGVRRRAEEGVNSFALIQSVGKVFGIGPDMSTIIPAPLYHSAPNAFSFIVVFLQGFVVLQPRFDAEDLLALVERHKISHLQTAPTMFVRLLKLPEEVRNKYDLSSLTYVVHTAAPCPPDVKEAMIDWWGPIIHEYYGSTELGTVTHCTSKDSLERPGTVGRPVEGAVVRIYDEEGKEVPTGEVGIIYSRLLHMSDFTYHGDEEKRRSVEHEGLITCGDMGYVDADGFLFVCDRVIDMVISGGVNIYPAEIEAVLNQMPGVHDCGVFGIPDEDFGEALAAAIELEEGAQLDPDEVRGYLRERIAHYKVPKVVEFHDALPREDTGKLFKRRLREPYWADAGRKI